jgi:Na+/citrate or Na+/malate symporter
MQHDSWLKISLPAFPLAFVIFGVWLYWGDNPLPLLAPSLAFWGLVVLFYLFSHFELPNRSYPMYLIIGTTALWLVASITSHNLARFVASNRYTGGRSVLWNKDFWYAYICAVVGGGVGLGHFIRLEPQIVAQVMRARHERDDLENA